MSYDLAGRLLAETTGNGTLSHQYDQAANRSRVTWPDGFYTTTTHDALERALVIADSAGNTLASYGYDTLGRRNAIARGNATSTSFAYDNADRLTSLSQAFTGANVTFALTYNPASQILVRTVSNGTYDIGAPAAQNLAKTYDGLNRDATIAAIGTQPCSTASGYDCDGNLVNDGTRAAAYDDENHLITASAPTAVSLAYDPLGRLQATTSGGATTTYLYAGDELVAELSSSSILRHYVHGPGVDEPLVWYEGSGTTDRRYLHADNQGSIIAWSDISGAVSQTYAYDPYGNPSSWSGSRFRYTGQTALPEAQLYHYKARAYDPPPLPPGRGRRRRHASLGRGGLRSFVGPRPWRTSRSNITDRASRSPEWKGWWLTGGANGRWKAARLSGGASDQLVRTGTENSRTLKFDSQGFERE